MTGAHERSRSCLGALLLLVMSLTPFAVWSASDGDTVTLAVRDVTLSEVMEMLSRRHRVNVLMGEGVGGAVSVNLYDVSIDQAIRSIAHAAGFMVEQRDGSYFIVSHAEAGKYAPDGLTELRSFEVSYANLEGLEQTLQPYLSEQGTIRILPVRRLLLVEDMPGFVDRIAGVIRDLDRPPRQILIEARILEVALDENQNYGIDWRNLFSAEEGSGSFGVSGFATPEQGGRAGFVFDLATPDVEVILDALQEEGRVRTLSTPRLLALENQEASVIVGDRRGYEVTTTINQVTTESIEFLESGVILRVTPTVDARGDVMMSIHPEVSTGSVDANGIPSQVTTEVNTQLLVPDGETVFIGGLIKNTVSETHRGVPVLGKLPVLRRVFSSEQTGAVNTETVVLIRPTLASGFEDAWNARPREAIGQFEQELNLRGLKSSRSLNKLFPPLRDDGPVEGLSGLRLSSTLSAD